jgi:fructose-specific phosphotransferase system IIA component
LGKLRFDCVARSEIVVKIGDILVKDSILLDLKGRMKQEVLAEMAEALSEETNGLDEGRLFEGLNEREKVRSTGIGEGVAIPHCKLPELSRPVGSFARSLAGVNFDSSDKELTHLFFFLAVPENSKGDHLKALARISRFMHDADFRERLWEAETREDVCRAVEEEDAKF